MKKLRIVFMGTPDFAVASLGEILNSEHQIVGVVTVPDKPAGRGQKIHVSAVKIFAETHNLPLLQPEKLKSEDFIASLSSLKPDVMVVVAFRMLPKEVWSIPTLGTFNLHGSLLPDYRGAAPLNWAIINGETKTGVTTFLIDEKIDTGNILLKEEIEINSVQNVGDIHDLLMNIGGKLVVKTLDLLATGNFTPIKQLETKTPKEAPKLNKENCRIDWHQDAKTIHDKIRGLSPYPTAWTFLKNKEEQKILKILTGQSVEEKHNLPIGSLIFNKKELKIAVKDGFYEIFELQLEGKKRMKVNDFLNGTLNLAENTVV